MFTGLVENVGRVTAVTKKGGGFRVTLMPGRDMELDTGDSVSVNGVCLTVVEKGGSVAFEVSPETIKSTNFAELKTGDTVNLERALRLGGRLGGHLVTGHVDGTGTVTNKRNDGEYTLYTFETSPEIMKYIVKKGSVAVDGISLTVTGLDSRSFSVAIIPHTMTATNIGGKGVGDRVNLEADIIGKYIEKLMNRQDADTKLAELLREKGFTQ